MYKTSSTGQIPLGVVVGMNRQDIASIKKIAVKVKGSFGRTAGVVVRKKEQLIQEAIEDLQKKVKALYPTATAIYDIDYHFNTDAYSFDLAITGTAVTDASAAAPNAAAPNAAAPNAAAPNAAAPNAATRRARQRRNRTRRS